MWIYYCIELVFYMLEAETVIDQSTLTQNVDSLHVLTEKSKDSIDE